MASGSKEFAEAMLSLFPDISPDYVRSLGPKHGYDAAAATNFIIDQQVQDRKSYPTQPTYKKSLKRKRGDDDSDDEPDAAAEKLARLFDNPQRRAQQMSPSYISACEKALMTCFPHLSRQRVSAIFAKEDQILLQAFLAINEAIDDWGTIKEKPWTEPNPTHEDLKDARKKAEAKAWSKSKTTFHCDLWKELSAAIEIQERREYCRRTKLETQATKERLVEEARLSGDMQDCQCCFCEYPPLLMVHCNGERAHPICSDCVRNYAETQVGLSRSELTCMSPDGCSGGFSNVERLKCLDKRLTRALDRIEAETAVRLAGLDDLASCPFCSFSAEYPPIEQDKEFRCLNEACEMVSCRLCKRETHLPETCEETKGQSGLTARQDIEEAMSEAMIRRCNKCATPFIREEGCNKMTCATCHNIQCYVCSLSCDYTHFDSRLHGGREGNCALFTNAEHHHAEEVKNAEQKARARARLEHPNISEDQLNINMSDIVQEDDRRREQEQTLSYQRRFPGGAPPGPRNAPRPPPAANGGELRRQGNQIQMAEVHRAQHEAFQQQLEDGRRMIRMQREAMAQQALRLEALAVQRREQAELAALEQGRRHAQREQDRRRLELAQRRAAEAYQEDAHQEQEVHQEQVRTRQRNDMLGRLRAERAQGWVQTQQQGGGPLLAAAPAVQPPPNGPGNHDAAVERLNQQARGQPGGAPLQRAPDARQRHVRFADQVAVQANANPPFQAGRGPARDAAIPSALGRVAQALHLAPGLEAENLVNNWIFPLPGQIGVRAGRNGVRARDHLN